MPDDPKSKGTLYVSLVIAPDGTPLGAGLAEATDATPEAEPTPRERARHAARADAAARRGELS